MISIIIATFNSGSTIERALNSVVNQSFQDWECIVVDGLSNDNTIEIIESFVGRDARIRYISEKDNGIYNAFNKGWRLAKGDWVYYLGSDDFLSKESFMDFFPNDLKIPDDVAIISGAVFRHSRSGRISIVQSRGFKAGHQTLITRKSVIQQLGGFDENYKLLADAELKLRIKNKGYKIINVQSVVAHRSYGGASERLASQFVLAKERAIFYKNDKSIRFPYLIIGRKFCKSVLSITLASFLK